MNKSESRFSPEYEFMNDLELKELQFCLDGYVSARNPQERESAKNRFPILLQQVYQSCKSSPDRIRLLALFIQKNIMVNYSGGIGKDMNNPVIKAISDVNNSLAENYKDIWEGVKE
jgi:hypothetical protein